ncbi:MAG: hypothetical protein ACRCSF_13975 [Mycobacteriaceae bacterium]
MSSAGFVDQLVSQHETSPPSVEFGYDIESLDVSERTTVQKWREQKKGPVSWFHRHPYVRNGIAFGGAVLIGSLTPVHDAVLFTLFWLK